MCVRTWRSACVIGVPAMSHRDELRAKAQQFLEQAKAAHGSSESLVYLLRSMECDTQADRLEECEMPEANAVNHRTRDGARGNA